jgi:redox-sensitive bicupin YhaK (pirin superfamily)
MQSLMPDLSVAHECTAADTPASIGTEEEYVPMRFSSVISTHSNTRGPVHSVRSVDLRASSHLTAPFTTLDHFRVTQPTFGPRLEPGACAATYVLQDSMGSLRSRDSLGNDIVTRPGGLLWTQSGGGVMHEHLPAEIGRELHGLHCCINLGTRNSQMGAAVFRLDPERIPEWRDSSGDRVRVVAGSFEGLMSPLMPASPLTFLDVYLRSSVYIGLRENHTALVYVLSGIARVFVDTRTQPLEATEAIAIQCGSSSSLLQIIGSAHLLILSGAATTTPPTHVRPAATARGPGRDPSLR